VLLLPVKAVENVRPSLAESLSAAVQERLTHMMTVHGDPGPGCEDRVCAADALRASHCDEAVYGVLSPAGDTLVLSLTRLSRHGVVRATIRQVGRAAEGSLLGKSTRAASELFDVPTPANAQAETASNEPVRRALGIAGASGLTAGAVLGGMGGAGGLASVLLGGAGVAFTGVGSIVALRVLPLPVFLLLNALTSASRYVASASVVLMLVGMVGAAAALAVLLAPRWLEPQ
jgi:hypothetical protein